MIVKKYSCRDCGSFNIVKNGHTRSGSQQYLCKDCGSRKVLNPKIKYSEERKEEILRAYQERSSQRGVARTFGISRQTLVNWLKKKIASIPPVSETLLPAQPNDILELDELWSFVRVKVDQIWLWTAMCRRTRQIVAYLTDDRSEGSCWNLWRRIPVDYRKCHSFSDFHKSYAAVFSEETHRSVGKWTGETNHMERWNNTLRQRIGRFVRKTLSFSKSYWWHDKITHWFINTYNLSVTAI